MGKCCISFKLSETMYMINELQSNESLLFFLPNLKSYNSVEIVKLSQTHENMAE